MHPQNTNPIEQNSQPVPPVIAQAKFITSGEKWIIIAVVGVLLCIILASATFFFYSQTVKIKLEYGPINSISLPLSEVKNLTVSQSSGVSIEKAIVATRDAKAQISSLFKAGQSYVMYFSGVKGFTEFTDATSSEKFVDLIGSNRLYDQNDNIIFDNPNVFSYSFGRIPIRDAPYLSADLTLNNDFPAGNYRWEFVVTDNKNSQNTFTGVVYFMVETGSDVKTDTAESRANQQPSLSELQNKYFVPDESGISKIKKYYINFNNETYYLAWSNIDEDVYRLEFLRSQDDWTNFGQLLSVIYYKTTDFSKFTEEYISKMKELSNNRVSVMALGDDTAFSLYYTSPDLGYLEYNLEKISVMDVNTVRVEIFTKKYPLPKTELDQKRIEEDIKNNLENWTNNNGIYYLDFEIK